MKRKLFDENGRLFGKISVVDVMAVGLALLVALMVYVRFFSGAPGSVSRTEYTPVSYQLIAPGVRQYTVDAIKEGDMLYVTDEGTELGKVTAVEVRPAVKKVETVSGTVQDMEVEGYYDVIVSVEGTGSKNGDRCYISGTFELGVNDTVKFCSKYVSCEGKVYSIQ